MKKYKYLILVLFLVLQSCTLFEGNDCPKGYNNIDVDSYNSCVGYKDIYLKFWFAENLETNNLSYEFFPFEKISDLKIRLGYWDQENLTFYVAHENNPINKNTTIKKTPKNGETSILISKLEEEWFPDVNKITATDFNSSARLDLFYSAKIDNYYYGYIYLNKDKNNNTLTPANNLRVSSETKFFTYGDEYESNYSYKEQSSSENPISYEDIIFVAYP